MNSRRALIFILLICVLGSGRAVYAQTEPQPAGPSAAPVDPAAVDSAVRDLSMLVGRSTLVEVGSPIARVSLTSAEIADAMVTSPNQLLVHAKVPGRISMFVWDRAGAVMLGDDGFDLRGNLVLVRDLQPVSHVRRDD